MLYKDIVDTLIDFKIDFIKNYPEEFKVFYSPLHWAEDFCTVSLDVGRRVGKTTYIKERATKNDLVISCFDISYKNLGGRFAFYNPLREENLYALYGRKYDTVYIDNASFVFSKINKDSLYNEILKDGKEHLFICLG